VFVRNIKKDHDWGEEERLDVVGGKDRGKETARKTKT
jgi:hypothetical protein